MTEERRPPANRASPAPDSVAMDLYEQPGHLIRRAHQIAVGTFNELVGPDVTPIQYAILRMVHELPGIDQVGLARHIALDTSTAALTAARLEARGLLSRKTADGDRRQLRLVLTDAGETLLANLVTGVHGMRERLLGALEPGEQALFMSLLRKFVHLNNAQSRAPLKVAAAKAAPAPPAVPDVPAAGSPSKSKSKSKPAKKAGAASA